MRHSERRACALMMSRPSPPNPRAHITAPCNGAGAKVWGVFWGTLLRYVTVYFDVRWSGGLGRDTGAPECRTPSTFSYYP